MLTVSGILINDEKYQKNMNIFVHLNVKCSNELSHNFSEMSVITIDDV